MVQANHAMVVCPFYKARSQLSRLIRLALQGAKLSISRGDAEPGIELLPARGHAKRRLGGLRRHKFEFAEDFNVTPGDFKEYEG